MPAACPVAPGNAPLPTTTEHLPGLRLLGPPQLREGQLQYYPVLPVLNSATYTPSWTGVLL